MARDTACRPCAPLYKDACRWCLEGAVRRVYASKSEKFRNGIRRKIIKAAQELRLCGKRDLRRNLMLVDYLTDINDSHLFRAVQSIVRLAKV